jgi:hypothetical protein
MFLMSYNDRDELRRRNNNGNIGLLSHKTLVRDTQGVSSIPMLCVVYARARPF